MMLAGEQSNPVHNPVSRNIGGLCVGTVHSPAYHACRTFCSDIFCNCTVGSHSPGRNPVYNGINFLKKGIIVPGSRSLLLHGRSLFNSRRKLLIRCSESMISTCFSTSSLFRLIFS